MSENTDLYRQILKKYWGYDDFRGVQRDIIESIGSGNDTLGLMPTGGGKSVTFQVPALAMEGVCVVVTPLIALMKDQVQNLRRRGIMATAVYSGMSRDEIVATLENCILGHTKLLYVSPERLGTDLFKVKLGHMKVSFITVDEAHCISQWGYDFRPSYLKIADIRAVKPDVPVLALTATATPEVVDDIQERLLFRRKNVFRMSFERKNLAYVVRTAQNKEGELVHILRSVPGSAIVYVRSRRRTREICELVKGNGINATFYHAGLEHHEKDERQRAWHDDEVRVMVATNAFGMGIDKTDVRLVVHYECPNSLEAYFHEAGRAGRDGKTAYAVLLYNGSDERNMRKRVPEEFPEKPFVRDVYEHLAYFFQIALGDGYGHTFQFDISKFSYTYGYFPVQVNSALKILQRAGYIYYDMEPDAMARLRFLLGRDDLYRFDDASPEEDAVVQVLLRKYSGLFTDYRYIDEGLLSVLTGLSRHQVYMVLRDLSQRHIIHFIPQRKIPTITYVRDREEASKVIIGPEAYDNLLKQFVWHINTMVAYAQNFDICRSRQLLHYFGETRSEDCGICDVCLNYENSEPPKSDTDAAIKTIMQFLSDGKRHSIMELKSLNLHPKALKQAIMYMQAEELACFRETDVWVEMKDKEMGDEETK